MQINSELTEYLERISMLRLSDDERQSITAQLQEFLEYTDVLDKLNTAAPETEAVSGFSETALRADEVKPSLPVEDVLKNAPRKNGDFFAVPKAVD